MKKKIFLQVSLLMLTQWCFAQSSISEFNRKDPVKVEKKDEDNWKSERTIMIYGNPVKMNELRVSGTDTNFLNSRFNQVALKALNDSISNIYRLLNSQAIESQKAINRKEKNIKEIEEINKKMQNLIKELQEKRDDLQRLVEKTNEIMRKQKDSLQQVQNKLIENRNAITTNFIGLARVRYFETAKDLEKQYTELKARAEDVKKIFEKDSIISKDDTKKRVLRDTLLAVSKNIIKIDNFRDTLTLSIGNDTAIVNIKRMEGIRKTSNQLIQASYTKLDALYSLKSVSKVDDKDNITSLIETLPSIVATSAFFVPTVSLLGSFTKKDNAFSANVQIFRGTANADTTQFDNLRKLIEPNASNFGINLSIFKAFDIKDDDSKRFLGVYLKNYFLFKDLPNQKTIQTKSKEGSKVINTAFIQINSGIEFAPVPKIRDVFTVYSGGNFIWNLNQYDNFKSYFQNNTKKVQYYFNTGFRFSIPLAVDAGKISNSLLVVDINCLFVNQSLRQLHNISDSVIPVMSLGIKKSIAKL